ncbi:TPA: hypothetical protein JI043_16050 [Acinetobacter baumannii]|nr:hypothetical protein ACX61_13370 [Acinetobacter baumannii]APO59246.1 hypothetical protein BBX32_12175 [Acinetobacter baumannii]ARG38467.1 hypothetical protein B7L35_06240 [Acinetobacter baumannii]KHV94534.1 hypothetical protein RR09_03055 [Acinetobacter baumannii]KKD19461.1 hypothetical protein MRSN16897_07855 [Acinetobacter baumannii]
MSQDNLMRQSEQSYTRDLAIRILQQSDYIVKNLGKFTQCLIFLIIIFSILFTKKRKKSNTKI